MNNKSALNQVVEGYMGALPAFKDGLKLQDAARAELAALRAQAALLDDYAATIRAHEITITEQAAQAEALQARVTVLEGAVSEARGLIQRGKEIVHIWLENENRTFEIVDDFNTWLAAHPAPAPEHCPLCTWRGPVELVNGVCPQCDFDFSHADADSIEAERVARLKRMIDPEQEQGE